MKKRPSGTLLTALLALVLAACHPIDPAEPAARPAEDRVYRIGFGGFGPDIAADSAVAGYLEALEEEGFEEGRNLEVVRTHASGEMGQLPQVMQSLDARGLDILVPMTTPGISAALGVVRNTPMVFVYSYDPIGAGAGESYDKHLPNITGVASLPPIGDTMELVLEMVAGTRTVGVLYSASETNCLKAVKEAREALEAHGAALVAVTVTGTADVFSAAQALVAKAPDVIWLTGNTVLQVPEGAMKPAIEARIPIILNDPEFVDRGALAAVGVSWDASGRAAGKMAARVLRGEAKPADLPIVALSEPRMVLNQAVAEQLGITFAPSLLEEAAEVIGAGQP